MSPLTLALLRRLAALFVGLAVLLAVGPPLLRDAGLVGPDAEEEIAAAARSLEAARRYGAAADSGAVHRSEAALLDAQAQLQAGNRRAARAAAERAAGEAFAAQREALAGREVARRDAQAVVGEIERRIEALEELYAEASRDRSRSEMSPLPTRMKQARQAGALVFVAFEHEDFARVIADGPQAAAAIETVRHQVALAAAARRAR